VIGNKVNIGMFSTLGLPKYAVSLWWGTLIPRTDEGKRLGEIIKTKQDTGEPIEDDVKHLYEIEKVFYK